MNTNINIYAIIIALAFCMLCVITLFAFSNQFVYFEVTPKWFGLSFAVSFIVLIYIIVERNIYLSTKATVVLVISIISIFSRDWLTIGFNHYLLMYSGCLFLLFFFFQQIIESFPINYLYGIVVLCVTLLAIYGIFQHIGIFPSKLSNNGAVGNFDNTAGFAAALAIGFPYSLYFIQKTKRFKSISISVAILLFIGIILSGSRTALIASIVVIICYINKEFPRIRNRQWIKIFGICLFTAITGILYFLKKDSADGRLFIWQCTWNMIQDKPFFGHGYGAFQSKYMIYQADYFYNHTDKYVLLADNVLYPFNEYLLLLSEYGIIGFACLILFTSLLFHRYSQKWTAIKFYAMLGILSAVIFSFFSYPFKYPFTWIIVLLNIVIICRPLQKLTCGISYAVRTSIIIITIWFTCILIPFMNAEITWNRIAKLSLAGKTKNVLPKYNKLYQYLGRNGLFLYNHAAELHYVKEFEKSLSVLELCEKFYNDMDVQMLFADNYMKLHNYDCTEYHLKLASAMCPVRFIPLYQLVELYVEIGRKDEALFLARHIIKKEIKISSEIISEIKQRMNSLIQYIENEDILSRGRSP